MQFWWSVPSPGYSVTFASHLSVRKDFQIWTVGNWSRTGPKGVIDMIAAALAHVALTKCKWHHPSNCRQKGSRGQLSDWRLQDRLKPNYPFVSSGRSINPTRVNVRARERENIARESQPRFLMSIYIYFKYHANWDANWKKIFKLIQIFNSNFHRKTLKFSVAINIFFSKMC